MSESGTSFAASGLPALVPSSAGDVEDSKLRDLLKRCSPATLVAARHYRRTRRKEYVSPIVFGVISRYVSREREGMFERPADELRLVEDLGLDSLSMIEISMTLEDALMVSLNDEKLRHLKTLGDVDRFACSCLPK